MTHLQTKKQTETAQELDAMLESHRDWVYQLNKTLICGLPPADVIIARDAHTHCTLGNWLEERALELDLDPVTLKDLTRRHKKVHDLARDLAITIQSGGKIEEQIYDSFLASSQDLSGLIEASYDAIVASINATDPLTGAENRSLMDAQLRERRQEAIRAGLRTWLLMIDLDHFKSINDRFGHELGDKVLKGFASVVRDHIRTDDLFFRYGGEEFLLCVSDVGKATIARVAERLRQAIADFQFEAQAATTFSVTASFVVAPIDDGADVGEAINAADAAMYAAKRAGRNNVVFADTRRVAVD
ncbi:diguanylate cyclase [Roseibium sp. M-1]